MYFRQEFKTSVDFRAGYPCKTADPTIDIKCRISNPAKNSEELAIVAKVDSGFGKGIALNNKLADILKIDLNKCKTIEVSTISGMKKHQLSISDSLNVKFNMRYVHPKNVEDEYKEFAYEAIGTPIEITPDLPNDLVLLGVLFMEHNGFELVFNGQGQDKTKEKYLKIMVHEDDEKKLIEK